MKEYTQISGLGGWEWSCDLLGGEVFWGGRGDGEGSFVMLS